MAKKFSVKLPLSKLRQWIACGERLTQTSPQESCPLIDIVQDDAGHEIKIYVDNHR